MGVRVAMMHFWFSWSLDIDCPVPDYYGELADAYIWVADFLSDYFFPSPVDIYINSGDDIIDYLSI